jgi:hypothetical protein
MAAPAPISVATHERTMDIVQIQEIMKQRAQRSVQVTRDHLHPVLTLHERSGNIYKREAICNCNIAAVTRFNTLAVRLSARFIMVIRHILFLSPFTSFTVWMSCSFLSSISAIALIVKYSNKDVSTSICKSEGLSFLQSP